MLTPPENLDPDALRHALEDEWGIRGELTYCPVGWGSHHWSVADTWFVTVDELLTRRQHRDEPLDLVFGRLTDALTMASGLHGLDFVVAPLPTGDGRPAVRLGSDLALHVLPFVVGQSFDWGEWSSAEHEQAALDMVIQLHQTSDECLEADVESVPYRDELLAAMTQPAPDCGPLARRSTELVATHRDGLTTMLQRYDAMVAQCGRSRAVITHGEPHPGNTMLTEAGWRLIDWDTVLVAPPERELWSLADTPALREHYHRATGFAPRADVLELYRVRWDLADIAGDVARLRSPHVGSANDLECWRLLSELVARVV